MEYKILFYTLMILLPAVMPVVVPRGNRLAEAIIFWEIILFVLIYHAQGMGWIFVILWMAVGIPAGLLYFSSLRLMVPAVKSALGYIARKSHDSE
jgi:hypothetical protein